MAVVVVVLLFGFIGGTALQRFLEQIGQGRKKVVAHFDENKKITQYELDLANRELLILKKLRAPLMLRNLPLMSLQYRPVLNLNALLLSELLFSDTNVSSNTASYIKQVRTPQGYTITNEQINSIYTHTDSSVLIWFLLKNEASLAGINTPAENVRSTLIKIIPQLFDGAMYSQVINSFVNPPRRARTIGIPEKEILDVFGSLLDILEYSHIICSSENVTEQQMKHNISLAMEPIDAEFVKFDASVFTENVPEPNSRQISEQFETYKKSLPGHSTEENTYGFGYKLHDRIQIQYLVVKLDELEQVIEKPTQQEALDFYQKNRERLSIQIPKDPNDPNSTMTTRTQTYPEVADLIIEKLKQDRINSKANEILQKAKSLTESNIKIDPDSPGITKEQFEEINDNYKTAAEQLNAEYKIKLYAGQTGLLSVADIQKDEYLGGLFLESYGFDPIYNPNRVWLSRILFAVDEIGSSRLGVFDVQKPKMFENIGPFKDVLGNIRALIRIVKAQKAAVPENINVTFSTETINLEAENNNEQRIYSVKEKIIEDLNKLSAMQIAKEKAEQFAALSSQTDWQNAINKFNQLYPGKIDNEQSEPNNFLLETLSSMPRISEMQLETFNINAQGEPGMELSLLNLEKNQLFIDKLYNLIPPDANVPESLPAIVEFKPLMSYYWVKELTVSRLNQNTYDALKAKGMFDEDTARTQSMASVHFNPENILKRTNFKDVNKGKKQPADANKPPKTGENT